MLTMLSSNYLGDSWYFAFSAVPWFIAGVIGGGMEEPGWRGFLQPALEEKLPFTMSSLCVAIIWAIWHIPSWFVQSIGQSDVNFFSFTLSCIGLSFVMATLYMLTKCVFTCVLFHSWSNALGSVFESDTFLNPPSRKLIIICAIQIIASTTIYIIKKNKESSSAR